MKSNLNLPVYPYANIVPLYPSATDSINENAVDSYIVYYAVSEPNV
jgi:hypothetical protein